MRRIEPDPFVIDDVRFLSAAYDRQIERWAMKDAYALRPEEWAAIRHGLALLGRWLLKLTIALLVVALWGAIGYGIIGGSLVFVFGTLLLLAGAGILWHVLVVRRES